MKQRLDKRMGVILVILGALFVVLWGVRIIRAVATLKTNVQIVQEIMVVDNPLAVDPATITNLLDSSRRSVLNLQKDTAFLLDLVSHLGWLPGVGPLLSDLPDLLTFGDIGTQTAVELWGYLQPIYVHVQTSGIETSTLTEIVDVLSAELEPLQNTAQLLFMAYKEIDSAAIPWRYQSLFRKAEPILSLYANGLSVIDDLPQLLGIDGPSTFLVLALNEDELRPSGGFISGVGELVMRDGKISSMDFRDSYLADDFSIPYPDPPQPLQQFMAIDLWVFRDSGWSPDFPTSARQAISLYRPGTPVTPTGVLALDQFSAEKIINVVGPLRIPGSAADVTGETLVDYMRNAWAPNNAQYHLTQGLDRKSFLGDITRATLDKVQSGQVDWTQLIFTAIQLVEQRHIQIYIDNDDAAAFLSVQKWDSAIVFPPQDMLLFVDTNVGYNKVSMQIERSLTYTVDLTQSPPVAEVTLHMKHLRQNVVDCLPEVLFFPEYEQSMERCYWSYLRFYVPEGAQLLDATAHPIEARKVLTGLSWPGIAKISQADEGSATVFEQAVLLPTGSVTDMTFRYNLPDTIFQALDDNLMEYKLTLQKQAGLQSVPTQVILRVPQNALLSKVLPDADSSEGGILLYNIDLQKNTEIELRFTALLKEDP